MVADVVAQFGEHDRKMVGILSLVAKLVAQDVDKLTHDAVVRVIGGDGGELKETAVVAVIHRKPLDARLRIASQLSRCGRNETEESSARKKATRSFFAQK